MSAKFYFLINLSHFCTRRCSDEMGYAFVRFSVSNAFLGSIKSSYSTHISLSHDSEQFPKIPGFPAIRDCGKDLITSVEHKRCPMFIKIHFTDLNDSISCSGGSVDIVFVSY